MRLLTNILAITLFFCAHAGAQVKYDAESTWSLQRCVQYAVDHNISIKGDSLTARLARYTLLQSQLSQLPTFNVNGSYGRSFGRSINPTTNQFIDASYNFVSVSGNSNVLLFGWNSVRNAIARNRYLMDANLADLDQLKDDISVNVANSFLAALLAKEQVSVSENQVKLSKAQLDQTTAFANAGRLPELNVAQLQSQLATDSSNLINAISNYNSSLLDLKTLLNLDFTVPFSIQVPDMEPSEELKISQMLPEEIYNKAQQHFGSIKGSQLRVQAAKKGLASAKGNQYPQLSLGYQLGTNWASNYYSIQQTGEYLFDAPIGYYYDSANNNRKNTVYQPVYRTVSPVTPFGRQLSNNFRQSVFLGLNIPIFSGWQTQYSIRQAKIGLAQQELNEYNARLTLRQNVYKAHNSAVSSIQKFYAAKRAYEAASRALEFAKKRYDLGLTSTVDLLVTQNQAFAAESNMISAKYDLIFKIKVVDYYLGEQLKL